MLSATFHDRGGGAHDPDFSVDLARSMATFCPPEILYIGRNCYASQGDPDFNYPYLHVVTPLMRKNILQCSGIFEYR